MADYSHEDLHLPIRNPPISGPGVDSLKRRKEDNNNERFTAEKLRNNFAAIRDSLLASLKSITQSQPR